MTASKHNTTINASQQVESCSKVLGFGELYAENQSNAVGQLLMFFYVDTVLIIVAYGYLNSDDT